MLSENMLTYTSCYTSKKKIMLSEDTMRLFLFSVILSRLEVASSNTRMGLSYNNSNKFVHKKIKVKPKFRVKHRELGPQKKRMSAGRGRKKAGTESKVPLRQTILKNPQKYTCIMSKTIIYLSSMMTSYLIKSLFQQAA